jgi:hypothetical protein
MHFSSICDYSVLKPMGYPDLGEWEEIVEPYPYSLDYQGSMRINDRSLLSMVSERDEAD